MSDLVVSGKQEFMGTDIPVVSGGFGEGKKCICDKTVGEIHDIGAFKVRERILSNISRFKENIDFIDLKKGIREKDTLKQDPYEASTLEILVQLGYAKSAITQAEHIYLLSERGYSKLIKIMDTDLAWEIHDRIMDEYFALREREQEREHQESLKTINDTINIFFDLQKRAGCPEEIQLLTAKTIFEKFTGTMLPLMAKADQQYHDTEYIARKAGIYAKSSGKPAEKAVNEIIRRLNITDEMYTETWETNGKWQGTVRKYSDHVIEMIKEWCSVNGYPEDIEYVQSDGHTRKYHVKWKRSA